jgi:cytochrome c
MLLAALSVSLVAPVARAASGSIDQGRRLAQANCAGCHAIAKQSASPNPLAPPFRDLLRNNPKNNLDEVFARGILVSHAAMPRFAAGPQDLDDLLAYVRSVQSPDQGF